MAFRVYSGYMKTPVRHVRVPDNIWAAAREQAWRDRTNVSAVIVSYLREYGGAGLHVAVTADERMPCGTAALVSDASVQVMRLGGTDGGS